MANSFIFDQNAEANAPGSYSSLEMRRRIAAQLAAQKKPYPKTFGEGLTYLGESLGEARLMSQLDAQERAYRQQQLKAAAGAPPIGGTIMNNKVSSADVPSAPAAAANAVSPPVTPMAAAQPTTSASGAANPTVADRPAMSRVGEAIGRLEPDPTMRTYLSHLAGREDPTGGQQVSPTGASGPFQFTRGTGREYGLVDRNGDRRTDVDASVQAAQALTRNNAAAFIKINGRVPSLNELALMHQQGGVTGARMIAGTANAPARNLAVNNIDPNLGPKEAAAKVMAYYKMPDAQMPEGYHLGNSGVARTEEGVGDTAMVRPPPVTGDDGVIQPTPEGGGRDNIVASLLGRADTAQGVPQENPTEAGPVEAPALPTGAGGSDRVQVASLDPSIGVGAGRPDPTMGTTAPMGLDAVAPPEAAGNPPIASDIRLAPSPQVAEAAPAGSPAPPRGIPGPLDPPTPQKPDPSLGRVAVPPGFGKPPVEPPPPVPAPVTPHEEWGYRQMMTTDDPAIRYIAEQQIKFGQAQRTQEDARRMDIYKAKRALFDQQQTAWDTFERDTPKREGELRKTEQELGDKARQDELRQRLGGIDPKWFEAQISESQKNVVGLPGATQALANARRVLVDEKAFTGSDAEIRLSTAKLLQAAGFPANPQVPATEQFRSFMAPVVAQMRQALVGGAQISNADIQMAEKAGGGQITLDRDSIKGIMSAIERINLATAVTHQRKLLTYSGDDPDRQRNIFGVVGVPTATMEQLVPEAAKAKLREHANNPVAIRDFDSAFSTPGLAAKILSGGR